MMISTFCTGILKFFVALRIAFSGECLCTGDTAAVVVELERQDVSLEVTSGGACVLLGRSASANTCGTAKLNKTDGEAAEDASRCVVVAESRCSCGWGGEKVRQRRSRLLRIAISATPAIAHSWKRDDEHEMDS